MPKVRDWRDYLGDADPDNDRWLDDHPDLVVRKLPARYYGERIGVGWMRSITLHHGTTGGSVARYMHRAPDGRVVSAHCSIGLKGEIFQMVPLDRAAWHATRRNLPYWPNRGKRYARGHDNPGGGAAIGVEMDRRGNRPITDDQYLSLMALLEVLIDVAPIEALEAHSHVQPDDRSDPVDPFPWAAIESLGLPVLR